MKLISEEEIKRTIEAEKPKIYYIPEGRILSPAAKDYLNSHLIRIDVEKNRKCNEQQKEKPEFMTHVYGQKLVMKDDPVIRYRGRMDRFQTEIIFAQCMIQNGGRYPAMIEDLEEILSVVRELIRCEVMNEPFVRDTIIGLTAEGLREHSHDPMKFYHVHPMTPSHHSMGLEHALLDMLRAGIREAETMAVVAFREGDDVRRKDIIRALNRLSSALHIMMCKCLSGDYCLK